MLGISFFNAHIQQAPPPQVSQDVIYGDQNEEAAPPLPSTRRVGCDIQVLIEEESGRAYFAMEARPCKDSRPGAVKCYQLRALHFYLG